MHVSLCAHKDVVCAVLACEGKFCEFNLLVVPCFNACCIREQCCEVKVDVIFNADEEICEPKHHCLFAFAKDNVVGVVE